MSSKKPFPYFAFYVGAPFFAILISFLHLQFGWEPTTAELVFRTASVAVFFILSVYGVALVDRLLASY